MGTYRIDLGECGPEWSGQWVDIRERRSWAARQRIDAATLGGSRLVGTELQVVPDLVARAMAVLAEAIVGWSLVDSSGSPLPAGREGFEHEDFDEQLGDWLVRYIESHYDGHRRGADGRKNSVEPSTPSSNGAAGEGSPLSSHTSS